MESFAWETAPLHDIRWPAVLCAVYLITVLGGMQRVVKVTGTCHSKPLMVVHNAILSLGSLAMFIGAALAMVERGQATSSWEWLVCESADSAAAVRSQHSALYFWSYVYYLSKFYELLDTLFQLAKGGPVRHPWLHIYHHAVVMFMAWSWVEHAQSLQFIGMLFNTAVHVVMYAYYGLSSAGVKDIWWKRYITKFQILQFACSFGFLLMTLRLVFGEGRECLGMPTLAANTAFNATLLVQFLGVLGGGGGKKKKKKKKKEEEEEEEKEECHKKAERKAA